MKRRIATVVIASLLLLVPAFGQKNRRPASPQAQARIVKEVRHQILMLPYFDVFDNIAYKVNGYNVTLLGQVTRPTLKSDAERVVKKIEGVEKVSNQIEVLPVSPNDDRLRRALFNAIYGYGPLQRYGVGSNRPIRIIVKNGHATLEGVVDSKSDRDLVNIRANGVPGVFSVTNHLTIPKEKRVAAHNRSTAQRHDLGKLPNCGFLRMVRGKYLNPRKTMLR